MARKYDATALIGRLGCGVRTTRPVYETDKDGKKREVGRAITTITLPDGTSSSWSDTLHDVFECYEAKVLAEAEAERQTDIDNNRDWPTRRAAE